PEVREGEPAAAREGDPVRAGVEVEDLEAAKEGDPPPEGRASGEPPSPAPFVLAGSSAAAQGLEGRPAIVDLPLGRGHTVLFAWDALEGGRGRADLRWVYNLLLNWSHLPG